MVNFGGSKSNKRGATTVNPESPRTIEACLELGINSADLHQKYLVIENIFPK